MLDALQKSGIVLHLNAACRAGMQSMACMCAATSAEEFALPAERVLVAVGRRPRVPRTLASNRCN